ncbi:helix-turn-helix transcriptional regulator [Vulcanisaeta sp. JCM 14467]|uniref:helix-turn-helix transcriptional regulator n=1 Tax=Vulcanisaeta sp. JCM 14467 TaxID=1295370 RepID=UPI0006D2874A|nr:helix-turn-helix transcriptional regulator [Vulcanisaeta sp. JCM 14467]
MVDCGRIDVGEVRDEDRLGILNYVMGKKDIKPHDLGVTSQYINAIRHGRRRVSDDLLCKLLSFLTYEKLASLLRGWVPEGNAGRYNKGHCNSQGGPRLPPTPPLNALPTPRRLPTHNG